MREAASSEEQRFIETEQVKAYFAGVGDVILAGALVFTLLVFAVHQWPPAWSWGPALLMLYAVTVARMWLVWQYGSAPQSRSAARWAQTQLIGSAVSGLLWGGGSAAMLPFLPTDLQLLVLAVISVVAASAIAESVSLLQPPSAFLVAAIAPPMVWSLTVADRLHATLAVMLMVFIVLMLRLGRKRSLVFIEQQQLRFRNVFLAQELARQRDAAEQAHQSKTRFLAAASHDLRQPMHALAILLDLLGSELKSSERGHGLLVRAQQAADAMNGLLDTLLDISRLDAGVVEPRREAFALPDLLAELKQEFLPLAEEKGLRLDVMTCTAVVDSDPVLLGQMLRNLLANAVRYTSSGRILLGCRRRPGAIVIQVCDTGIGIADDQHEAIFAEFYQIGNKQRDRREGLGLGLAIVSRVARMLDHPLTLRSVPSRGSCFAVSVPLARAPGRAGAAGYPQPPATAATAVELSGRLIVFIDDEEDIREAMKALLHSWGCAVIAVESAAAALVELAAAPGRVDAVISDMALQGPADGIHAIAELRRRFGAGLPALLVTGDTSDLAMQAARRAGVMMLHKPIKPERLRAALVAVMAGPVSLT